MQQDQARLRAIWDRVQADRLAKGEPRISQKELALKWDVTPPLVGHYLAGREPINVKWQLRFSEYLGVPVTEIWPDFAHAKALQSGLPQEAVQFALEFMDLLPGSQHAIRTTMDALPRRDPKKRDSR